MKAGPEPGQLLLGGLLPGLGLLPAPGILSGQALLLLCLLPAHLAEPVGRGQALRFFPAAAAAVARRLTLPVHTAA